MATNRIREEYLFSNASVSIVQAAHFAGIHNLKNKTTESCTSVRVTLRCK